MKIEQDMQEYAKTKNVNESDYQTIMELQLKDYRSPEENTRLQELLEKYHFINENEFNS